MPYVEDFTPDYSVIISDVTGGVRRVWPRGKDFPASQLSVKYAILHKIAMRNWLPTSHGTGVNKGMATLLYKIGNFVEFDVGQFIFDQIVKHADCKNERLAYPFPCLIYAILASQYPVIRAREVLETDREEIRISYKLLMGDHVNDMDNVSEDVTDTEDFGNTVLLSRTIKVLEDELRTLMTQQSEIEKRRKEISAVLDDLVALKTAKDVAAETAERKKKVGTQSATTTSAGVESSEVPSDVTPDVTAGILQNLSSVFAKPDKPIVEAADYSDPDEDMIEANTAVPTTVSDDVPASVTSNVPDSAAPSSTQSGGFPAGSDVRVPDAAAGVQLLADSVGLVTPDEENSE